VKIAIRVHRRDDVVRADGEAVVGRVAQRRGALRACEAFAEPVEAVDERGGLTIARRGLLDARGAGRDGHVRRWRQRRWLLHGERGGAGQNDRRGAQAE
jgi:hypothetical protein